MSAKSLTIDVSSRISLIFLGKSKISDFKFSNMFESVFSKISAKYIPNIANKTTCEVYAFVEATAISGPACV